MRWAVTGYNKQAVVDSRERVVFILVSYVTGYQLLMLKNWTGYIISQRNSDLEVTRGCGPYCRGQFQVNCPSLENRNILWVQQNGEHLLTCKRTVTKQSVLCGITLQLMPELLKILLEVTIIGVGTYTDSYWEVCHKEKQHRDVLVVRYLTEVFNEFPRTFICIPEKSICWSTVMYCRPRISAQATGIITFISGIYKNISTCDR